VKVAYFSPFPPAKSGIADYSQSLAAELEKLVSLRRFNETTQGFQPSDFDIGLYHVGNNRDHVIAYETALQVPGVVVLHEANLHHLLCDLTIRRNNWAAYVEEASYDSGPTALEFARRVERLEVGPDYDGVPMLRRLAERSRAAIAHSQFVLGHLQQRGLKGPGAVIPHGAALLHDFRNEVRQELGISPDTPLVGTFGYLKPYKRLQEALRAFRRVVKFLPHAKFLMAGEQHADFPLEPLIRSLGLQDKVILLGYTPIEKFDGYIGACDVTLNLRYPTVGETSGTLMRAFGMGKATIVSDVGSFSELPEGTCLKVPVGASEEDLLFEYLQLVLSRPEIGSALGFQAKRWVETHCQWPTVAKEYASFLESVVKNSDYSPKPIFLPSVASQGVDVPLDHPIAEYLRTWNAKDDGARTYREGHMERFVRTLEACPKGAPSEIALEMGAYMQTTPALRDILGFGSVEGCYFGPLGNDYQETIYGEGGKSFSALIKQFDAEKDVYPYEDQRFSLVLCCELLEHLPADPMFMMSEINRILKPGGHVVITTPNAASARGLRAILLGYHPGFFSAYTHPDHSDDPRHAREYAPGELAALLEAAGFSVTKMETCEFISGPKPELAWVMRLLEQSAMPTHLRGDDLIVVGRKTGPVKERYPQFLYV
jgi:glycosyltransferase involved in cell wall biosynthesis/SAM-dependent methyltransferase